MSYIEREAAIRAIENDCLEAVYYTKRDAIDCIEAQPTADVVEVRHGYWVRNEDHDAYECEHFCSECLADGSYDVSNEKYCYNCGAKMDGERSKE